MARTLGEAYINILPSTKEFGNGLTDAISSAVSTAAKASAVALSAGATAAAALTKQAVDAYADYEQLVGGVETLFGDSASIVINNASRAFETAGISANEYMESVTSFSASLLSSLGGDTEAAANAANDALIAMSDNANKMGTSMESIQNAYQGFAKQNYTMLDNLKLGYGGTKSEMERLLADAQKISGIEYDLDNLADVYSAISVIQDSLGITGTTAEEAATTISGSIGMLSASWSNMLVGFADENADFDQLINDLVDSAVATFDNLVPVIEQSLEGLGDFVKKIAPVVAEKLPDLIKDLLPDLIDTGATLLETVLNAVIDNLDLLIGVATDLITTFATDIGEALPDLIPAIVDIMLNIVDTLIDNIDLLVDASITLMEGLTEGIINAIPEMQERLPEIVEKLCDTLVENLPAITETAFTLLIALAEGLVATIPDLLLYIPEIIVAMVEGLEEGGEKISEVGGELIEGLWNGIKDKAAWLGEQLSSFGEGVLNDLKKFFGINSPSRLMRDEIGKFLPEGIAVGIDANADMVTDAMDSIANQTLQAGISVKSDLANYRLDSRSSNVNSDNDAVKLLARWLPIIAENCDKMLQPDPNGIFKAVRDENNKFKKQTGNTAFA